MKREQRAPWIAVGQEDGWCLCSWCRYAMPEEWGLECEHPVEAVSDRAAMVLGMGPGQDCWGFRPEKGLTLEDAARIVAEQADEEEDHG